MLKQEHQEISQWQTINFFLETNHKPSFDPSESDLIGNQILLKHLVGTLVRYKSGGIFDPYLAKKWTISDNMSKWTFSIRENLYCEDGSPIKAKGYVESLLKLLSIYSEKGDIPFFKDLIGWKDFKTNHKIEGLTTPDPWTVVFNFSKPVNDGFLEYLSMPYYGFFCAANFERGLWKDRNSIISSGPYILEKTDNLKNPVRIVARTLWPLSNPEMPHNVDFFWSLGTENPWEKTSETIIQSNDVSDIDKDAYIKVLGPPDISGSIVLDVNKKSPFSNLNNRKYLRSLINQKRKDINLHPNTSTKTLFIDQESTDEATSVELPSFKLDRPLKIFSIKTNDPAIGILENILTQALDEMKLTYEFQRLGEQPSVQPTDKISREKFDIRIATVYSGASFDAWVVEMMFCSNLGISFPDPSSRICSLLSKYMANPGKFKREKVAQEVQQIMDEDSCVIPLLHKRPSFYFTKDIDLSKIGADLIVLSFDELRKK